MPTPHSNRSKSKRGLTAEAQSRLGKLAFPLSAIPRGRFQVLDFFCGCGGMSLGFASLHDYFTIIGGCDINKASAETFRTNFSVPCATVDIREVAEYDNIDLQKFLSIFPEYRPGTPTVLIGCAPCQGFTSHRKKHWHRDDHRNSLVAAFARLAVRLRPVAIVMENVPDLLAVKYWSDFRAAAGAFEEAGYFIHQTIYNAASFGVPQERFRAIVIAMQQDFALPEPLFNIPTKYRTVRQTIGKLPPVSAGQAHPRDPLHRSADHHESTLRTIRAVPHDGGSRPPGVGPACLDRVRGFSDVYGRLYWDRPAITLTHYARNPASGRYVHPEQDRGLTMREAMLLQSFPKRFMFRGTFDEVFRQIGEAVPPLFACGVAAGLAVELTQPATPIEVNQGIPSITTPVSNSFSSVIAGIKARSPR